MKDGPELHRRCGYTLRAGRISSGTHQNKAAGAYTARTAKRSAGIYSRLGGGTDSHTKTASKEAPRRPPLIYRRFSNLQHQEASAAFDAFAFFMLRRWSTTNAPTRSKTPLPSVSQTFAPLNPATR